MAKASRVAIKTAKAVVTVEERLTRIEQALEHLITLASADKPSSQGQEAPPSEEPRTRTARKRGEA